MTAAKAITIIIIILRGGGYDLYSLSGTVKFCGTYLKSNT